MATTREEVVRGLTLLVVSVFIVALSWQLIQSGYSLSRLMIFAVLGGFAIAGAVGVVFSRQLLATGAICGLVLLGFWQAVLWIYIFPVAGFLVVATVLVTSSG